jgi:hypothetical protein
MAAALWTSPPASAAAPVMIAPSGGGVHPVSQPLPVQWANIVQGSQVYIMLEARKAAPGPGVATVTLATHQPNSGTYTVPASALKPLCSSLPTSLQPFTQAVPVSQMSIVIVVHSYNNYAGHDRAESEPFRLKCPFDRGTMVAEQAALGNGRLHVNATDTGTLTIEKRVANAASIPPPDIAFGVSVTCSPGGPDTSVSLSAANNLRQAVPGIAAGSTCSIAERPPSLSPELERRGCSWQTSYPEGRRATVAGGANATLVVLNTWTCKPGAP